MTLFEGEAPRKQKKMKFRLLSIAALALASAFSLVATAETPAVTGIAHVAYRVANLDVESAFLKKLGYEQSFAITGKDGKVAEIFVKVNDRTFLELYPQTAATQPLGWMHICYEATDMVGYVQAISARGLKPSPVHKAGAGNLITAFNDPDGRTTEFTQYMPGSKHMLDQGQHLLPNRIAAEVEGVEFGVPDKVASRKFYEAMGMTVTDEAGGLRVRATSAAHPWIQLAAAGSAPKLVLRVASLKTAESQLKKANFTVKKDKKAIFVSDPDGNLFVFAEGEAK